MLKSLDHPHIVRVFEAHFSAERNAEPSGRSGVYLFLWVSIACDLVQRAVQCAGASCHALICVGVLTASSCCVPLGMEHAAC